MFVCVQCLLDGQHNTVLSQKMLKLLTFVSAIFFSQLLLSQGQAHNRDRKQGFFGLPHDMKPARSFRQGLDQRQFFRPTDTSFSQNGYDPRIPLRSRNNRYLPGESIRRTTQTQTYDDRPPAKGVPVIPLYTRSPTTRPPAKGFPPYTARPWVPTSRIRYTLPPPTFPPTLRLRPGETRPPAKGVPPFTPAPWASTPRKPPYPPPPGGYTRSYTQPPRGLRVTATPGPPAFSPPEEYEIPSDRRLPYVPPYVPPRRRTPPPYPVPPPTYSSLGTPVPPVTYPPTDRPLPSPPTPTKLAPSPPPSTTRLSSTTSTLEITPFASTPRTRVPFSSTTKKPPGTEKFIPNRMRGKAHVTCEPDGIVFVAHTFFPFFGEVFARDRMNTSKCFHQFMGESNQMNVTFPYKECGTPIPGARPGETMYQVEIVINYVQDDGTITVQSFLARCESQRIRYATEDIPRQIEEALEELNLVPIKLEKKAEVPDCRMRIVPESEHDHHSYGPSNKSEIRGTHIGQQLRIEWSLHPPSEAYGFVIKNCTVNDHLSGREYLVIDEKGCSTDINILGHPHYDTYHDLAIVHWHAFKVPDDATLSINCHFHICSEIEDDQGKTSCGEIPTPPFCPTIVTAPPNSLLFDFETNFLAQRYKEELFQVGAEVCVVDENHLPEQCSANSQRRKFGQRSGHYGGGKEQEQGVVCISRILFSALLVLSIMGFLVSLGIFLCCSVSGRKRRRWNPRFQHSWKSSSTTINSEIKTIHGSSLSLGTSSQNSCDYYSSVLS